jgi:glycosyltransferase involved in cell wall biosynthesis
MQVTSLIAGLDPDRYEHRVLVGTVEEGEGDHLALRAPGTRVEYVPGLGRSLAPGDARAFRGIVRVMRQFRPHIVHTHTAKAGVLGRLAAMITGVPATVHTYHGHLLKGYFSRPVTNTVTMGERLLARRTTRIVAVGDRVRDELVAAGVGQPGQYAVVPPGVPVPPALGRSQARQRFGLPLDAPVIAFVGRLTHVKRPDRFLDAMHLVLRQRPTAHVLIAGSGDLAFDVRQRASALGDRVRLLGWCGDVGSVYAAADVVVLTSDNEGMPVSLIEAAMLGCPAVTTDVGSASEVVLHRRTGLVVPPDAGAVANAVVETLGSEAMRTAMATAARDRALRLFSAERLVADSDRLYTSILAG